jgi:hypothetical protein
MKEKEAAFMLYTAGLVILLYNLGVLIVVSVFRLYEVELTQDNTQLIKLFIATVLFVWGRTSLIKQENQQP